MSWYDKILPLQKMIHLLNGVPYTIEYGGVPRSPLWRKVRDAYLLINPTCAVCGHTRDLNVHHIQPYHLLPSLELDRTNLITLGENCPTGNHHLLFGHLGDWKCYNPNVVYDTQLWLCKIKSRSTK